MVGKIPTLTDAEFDQRVLQKLPLRPGQILSLIDVYITKDQGDQLSDDYVILVGQGSGTDPAEINMVIILIARLADQDAAERIMAQTAKNLGGKNIQRHLPT